MVRYLLLLSLSAPCLSYGQSDADSVRNPAPSPIYFSLGIGTSIDKTTEDEAHSASAQAVVGWNFHRMAGAGIGLGIHDAFFNFEQFQYMPLFVQLRGKTPGKVGLVGFVNTGYSFALREDEEDRFWRREFEGGWLWHFGGGFRFRVKQSDLLLTLNHRSFESTIRELSFWEGEVTWVSENKRKFNRIEIMLALEI